MEPRWRRVGAGSPGWDRAAPCQHPATFAALAMDELAQKR